MAGNRKKFAEAGLTHSAAHHLLPVDEAIGRHGYARVCDIAEQLRITPGSVSVAMQSLKAVGYVSQAEHRFFHLTDTGRQAVASIRARHEIVERFLTEVLGLSREQSHRESCRVENLIEPPTARKLCALLAFWHDNHLEGALDNRPGPEWPVCKDENPDQCPCCGLECLADACSTVGGDAGHPDGQKQ